MNYDEYTTFTGDDVTDKDIEEFLRDEELQHYTTNDDTAATTTTTTTTTTTVAYDNNVEEPQDNSTPSVDIIDDDTFQSINNTSKKRKKKDYTQLTNIGVQRLDNCPKSLYTKVLQESLQKIKDCHAFPLWLLSYIQDDAVYRNQAIGWMPMFAKNKVTPKDRKAGANEYIITGYENMWRTINNTPPPLRNYFEQLLPMFPCHLYIDVEIYRATNSHRTREDIENTIHELAMKEIVLLMKEYKWITSRKQVEFLISESSNEKKVSLHFHVIVAGKRFYNNFHCGAFIRQFTVAMQHKYGKDPARNPFFFRMKEDKVKNLKLVDENEKYEFWADATVYTAYRVFRMWLNSKANDYRPLFPIDIHKRNRDTSNSAPPTTMDKATWFKSLLQCMTVEEVMNPNFALMTCRDPDGSIPVSHSNVRRYRLDIDYRKKRQRAQDPQVTGVNGALTSLDQLLEKKPKFEFTNASRYSSNTLLTRRIPALILKYWTSKFDASATRVQYVGYDAKRKIAYYSTDSRFCTMINGEHKSNHVKFQAYLERCAFYQTCYDAGDACSYDRVKAKLSSEFDLCVLDSAIQLSVFQFLKDDQLNINTLESNASIVSQYLAYQLRVPPSNTTTTNSGTTTTTNNTKGLSKKEKRQSTLVKSAVEWIVYLNQ